MKIPCGLCKGSKCKRCPGTGFVERTAEELAAGRKNYKQSVADSSTGSFPLHVMICSPDSHLAPKESQVRRRKPGDWN